MKVKIEKLDDLGRGIAYTTDKIVFVFDALPKEEVEIEIVKDRKNYCEAKVVEYIKKSPNRKEKPCPFFGQCGGCDLMHLDYEEELKYKEEKVKRILKKYCGLEKIVKHIIADDEHDYRNKAVFQVNNGKAGFYRKETYDVVELENCKIINNKINKLISEIKEKVSLENVTRIMIRVIGKDSMVVFYGKGLNKKEISKISDDFTSVYIFDMEYQLVSGKRQIEAKIGKYSFIISPDSFFQVNSEMCEKMYNKILEIMPETNNLLDLYCGIGTIGTFLSKKAKHVVGVEIIKDAVEDANENKIINKIDNIEFKCGDAGKIFEKLDTKFDTIVVDPPRSGLDKKTKELLLKSGATNIIYISCDAMTLARDLCELKKKYKVVEVTPVDMFPNTYQVENICLLKIK